MLLTLKWLDAIALKVGSRILGVVVDITVATFSLYLQAESLTEGKKKNQFHIHKCFKVLVKLYKV